jgi:hypothetical protein
LVHEPLMLDRLLRGPRIQLHLLMLSILLALPGLSQLSESEPPTIGEPEYVLEQDLPGFSMDQVGRWFRPLEQRLILSPEIDSVELSISPGKGSVHVKPKMGKDDAEFASLITSVEKEIGKRIPKRLVPASFTMKSRKDSPWLIALFDNPEKAERAKADLEHSITHIGELKLSKANSVDAGQDLSHSREAFRAFSIKDESDPYPWLSSVGRAREKEEQSAGRISINAPGIDKSYRLFGQYRNITSPGESRLDGEEASILALYPGEGGVIPIYQKSLSIMGREGLIIYDGARELIRELKRTGVAVAIGALLVGVLLLLSRKRLSEYGAILLVLPISLIPALSLIGYSKSSIHLLNLTALACCSGTLIDGAVLVVEELRYGVRGAFEASWMGTVTTIASFFPLFLLSPPIGSIIRQFALIPTAALAISLFYTTVILPLTLPSRERLQGEQDRAQGHTKLQKHNRLQKHNKLDPTGDRKAFRYSSLSVLLLLLTAPFILFPLTTAPPFSPYGTEKEESIHGLVDFPEQLPHSVIADLIPGIEESCNHYFPDYRTLIYREEKRITFQLFPNRSSQEKKEVPDSSTRLYLRSELLKMVSPLGGSVWLGMGDSQASIHFYILHDHRQTRERMIKQSAEKIQEIFPEGVLYSNEAVPVETIQINQSAASLFRSGRFPDLTARELSWRLGGGGITKERTIYPAHLNDIEHILKDYDRFLEIKRSRRLVSSFRRNGKGAARISLYLPENGISSADTGAIKELERELKKAFSHPGSGSFDFAPELKQEEEIRDRAAKGAILSLATILILLIFLYNSPLKPLFILTPVLSSLLWTSILLGVLEIPLTLPGVGALFFSTGIGVNTGLLLFPRKEKRGRELPSPGAIAIPVLTTLAGVLPILLISAGAARDLPIIILTTTLSSTLLSLSTALIHKSCLPGAEKRP